jgi:hypothetical protein
MKYIAHPYGGKQENIQAVSIVMELLLNSKDKRLWNNIYLSPIHNYGHLWGHISEDKAINQCLAWLRCCNEIWVFGDYKHSNGCLAEIKEAKRLNITIRYVDMDLSEI